MLCNQQGSRVIPVTGYCITDLAYVGIDFIALACKDIESGAVLYGYHGQITSFWLDLFLFFTSGIFSDEVILSDDLVF